MAVKWAPPSASVEPARQRAQLSRVPYLPGLDGLRVIAVLAVMTYHADLGHTHIAWMQGGFLGVEVFFVISGYLITLLLVGERERTGSVSLKNFWLRRFRRLVPAAFVMMAVVVTYSSFAGYLKDTLGKLKFATFWGILYASNWYQLLIGQSYGEDQGRPPLLRHMWSLAVEEQFYLIWPLVMVVVMTRYRRRMPKVAGAFLGIGVGLSVIAGIMFAAGVDWNWMYLGTQSRASGLLLGAGMAIMWRPYAVARSPLRNRGRLLSFIGIAGMAVLILAFANFRLTVQTDDGEVGWKWLWYGGMLLVDVATMCVIASATHFRSFFGQKALGAAPMVWIGVRSYGLYLWHWPIFMLVRPGAVDDGGDVDWQFWRVMMLRIVLTVLATELSFRFIETPIRQGRFSAGARSLFRPAPTPEAAVRRRGLVACCLIAVSLTFVGGYRVATASNTKSVADINQQAGESATCDVIADPSCLAEVSTSVATATSSATASSSTTATTSTSASTSATTKPGVGPVVPVTTPAPTSAPPTTKPPAPIPYYAIGDSVMLGAAQEMAAKGIVTDAKQSRQLKDGVAIVSFLRQHHLLGKVLIVHLGTNGTLSDSRIAELMSNAKGVPLVLFLTVRVPTKPWQDPNNAIIRALPSKYPNVKVLDWQNLSANQADVFYQDGVHLKQKGRDLYAALVAQAVGLKQRVGHTAAAVAVVAWVLRCSTRTLPCMTTPVRVAVTGAAGQIGYSLLFRIASGSMLGPDTPMILQLLEITPALKALEGVKMELDDCAFPLLADIVATDDADVAFGDIDVALLVGAMPRKAGMERADLLTANGGIFKPQGKALSASAKKDVKILVVGNPANTNAYIAQQNAPGLDPGRFTAMTRLDHNRAVSQIAQKLGAPVSAVKKMTIWGNHSTTQYPDLFHCEVDGKNAYEAVGDHGWVDGTFIPTVAKRGAAIIEARGASSAASAANAAVDHVRSWVLGTPEGDWVSMAVPSDGSYGVPEGLISSFPCTCKDGKYSIVQGLEIDDYSRGKIDASAAELAEERDAVKELGLV